MIKEIDYWLKLRNNVTPKKHATFADLSTN
jgi:hypothetical protein